MRVIGNKARRDPKRIVFAEADNIKILKAAKSFLMKVLVIRFCWAMKQRSGISLTANGIDIEGMPIFDPRSESTEEKRNAYMLKYFLRKGDAKDLMHMNQKK